MENTRIREIMDTITYRIAKEIRTKQLMWYVQQMGDKQKQNNSTVGTIRKKNKTEQGRAPGWREL